MMRTALLFAVLTNLAWAASPLDNIVAIVNEDVIVKSRLEQEISTIATNLSQQGTRLPAYEVLEKQVLEQMILTKLQLQIAERTGIRAEDIELNQALRNIAQNNNMTLEQFSEVLRRDGYSFTQFRETIREQIIIRRLRQRRVVNRIAISEREIENFLNNQVQQGNASVEYHIMHILIAIPEGSNSDKINEVRQEASEVLTSLREGADFQETAVAVSNSPTALDGGDLGWRKSGELPSLFTEAIPSLDVGGVSDLIRNASGFHIVKLADKRDEEKVVVTQTKARHILIKPSEITSDADVQIRLDQVRERILGGEDFETLARAHSEDPGSASKGGDLDWVSPGDTVGEFEEVMNTLTDGQISKPFKSRFGWHILQALERRQHDSTESVKKTRAAAQIRQRKIEEETQNWLRELRSEAYVEYRNSEEDDT
ncbi:MAG: peptidylprolyl isomerase [Pseudomonadota bacterium]